MVFALAASTDDQAAVGIEHRVEPLAPLRRTFSQCSIHVGQQAIRFHGIQIVSVHNLAHQGCFERVNGVFPHHMEAPPGDLLGEDGPLEYEDAHQVSEGRRYEQRKQAVRIMGQLEGEDDGGDELRASHPEASEREDTAMSRQYLGPGVRWPGIFHGSLVSGCAVGVRRNAQ